MSKAKTWFVVTHSNNEYSVQDKPQGGGTLLQVNFDHRSKHEAELVCLAANEASK
jgi:hypothetical protein